MCDRQIDRQTGAETQTDRQKDTGMSLKKFGQIERLRNIGLKLLGSERSLVLDNGITLAALRTGRLLLC